MVDEFISPKEIAFFEEKFKGAKNVLEVYEEIKANIAKQADDFYHTPVTRFRKKDRIRSFYVTKKPMTEHEFLLLCNLVSFRYNARIIPFFNRFFIVSYFYAQNESFIRSIIYKEVNSTNLTK